MACRGCSSGDGCSCSIVGNGTSIVVTGSGTPVTDPYEISFDGAEWMGALTESVAACDALNTPLIPVLLGDGTTILYALPCPTDATALTGVAADTALLTAAKWFFIQTGAGSGTFPAYTQSGAGPGQTLTCDTNGLLSAQVVDVSAANALTDSKFNGSSITPIVGDRVLVADYYNDSYQGVYTITNLGSAGTPWVLTMATDTDDAAESLLNYRINLAATTWHAISSKGAYNDSFVGGAYGWSISGGGTAAVYGAIATAIDSTAIGKYSTATGVASIAVGSLANASGARTVAIGHSAKATTERSVAIGYNSKATQTQQVVVGSQSGPSMVIRQQVADTIDHTMGLSDAGTTYTITSAIAKTFTLPTNATTAIQIGSHVRIRQGGSGQITVAAAGGVTLRAPAGAKTTAQYSMVEVEKIGTDEWYVYGQTTV